MSGATSITHDQPMRTMVFAICVRDLDLIRLHRAVALLIST